MTDLTTPRYIVIADYPNSPFKVGEILIFIPQFMHRNKGLIQQTQYSDVYKCLNNFIFATDIDKYPHLFRRLEWWEHRDIKDMPQYVKWEYNGKTGYNKLQWKSIDNFVTHYCSDIYPEWVSIKTFDKFIVLPATKSDYDNYIKTNQ